MTEIIQPIPARIKNVAINGHVAGTEDIIDDTLGKTQQTINQEIDNKIEALTSQDIEVVSALPAVGDADPKKIYRVTGTTSYTDYMLNPAGTAFSQLATFSFPGIDDEPVEGSNNLVKSGGIAKHLYREEGSTELTLSTFNGYATVSSSEISETPGRTWGFKYAPVQKGEKYIISAVGVPINYPTYIVIAFSLQEPADGVHVTPLKTVATAGVLSYDFEYTAPEDGYLLQYNHNLSQGTIKMLECALKPLDDIIEEVETEQADMKSVLSSPKEEAVTDVGEWLGMCEVSNSKFTEGASTWGFKYIPIIAGNKYTITAENVYINYTKYALVVFSPIIPVTGSVGTVLKVAESTTSSFSYVFEYEATENGYLMAYDQILTSGKSSFAFTSLNYENGLENTMQRISDLEKGGTEDTDLPRGKMNVVCSGSSITWGNITNGVLDSSMVKYVDGYLKNVYAKTLLSDDDSVSYSSLPSAVANTLMYDGKGNMIAGNGKYVEFDLFGDEIAICQMKRRSSDYGIMKVTADGSQIGVFDNKNPIYSTEETFTGTAIREIKLSHPCTFNHQIYINGSVTPLDSSRVIINEDRAIMPADCDAWIFRGPKTNGAETCHYIQFADSLGDISSVRVIYDYGRIIAHERSTLGQLTSDEYANEYIYGKSSVSYDPARPTTGINGGIEFRAIDERAFFIHKFKTAKKRHFKIEIIGGENPYFIFNFATNRYHNLMNAGIGGWQLSDLLHYSGGMNNYTQFLKYFRPDIIFEEAMTNDDWETNPSHTTKGAIRRISRSIGEVTLSELQKMHQLEVQKITYNSSTNKYAVEMCTGIIDSITPTSLVSSDIVGTATQVGDIIRIGNYHGDMQQITCRRITNVNTTTGEVQWLEPVTAASVSMIDDIQDLVGAEINIRNLDWYKDEYVELITKVHAISPATKIVVVHNGLPNLWTRQLWGYDIIHAELAHEYNNVEFVNAQQHILDAMNWTISGSRHETITSTGADTYTLSFQGSQYKGWQGFRVLVNGVDVYGKDAYVEMIMAYRVKDTYSGAALNKTSAYDKTKCDWVANGVPFTLHFTKNVPDAGATIEVQFADELWSGDFCHVGDLGAQLYGESYKEMLDKL